MKWLATVLLLCSIPILVLAQQQTDTKPLVITVTTSNHSAILTWGASPTTGILGYHVWRASGGGFTQIGGVPAGGGNTYSVPFTATENPISQGGNWLNGHTNGGSWGDVQTTSGHAFGTILSPGCPQIPTDCTDNAATLTGSWSAAQSAQGTIFTNGTLSGCCGEVEIKLRQTIASGSIRGYEINCSVSQGNYLQLVRWNGPLGNWTALSGAATSCVNADVLGASIDVNNVITATKNGTVMFTYKDTTPVTGGSPGMSFYSSGSNIPINLLGFTSFTATGGSALSFTDSTVVGGTTYTYAVTAYSAACPATPTCGESANSNQVTAVVP